MIQITKSERQTESNDMTEFEDKMNHNREQRVRPRWPLFLVVLLLIAIGLIGYAEINDGQVSKLITRFFGPPQVTLKESFIETPDGPIFDHSSFNAIVASNVDDDGWVDYQQIKVNESKLDAYLETLGEADIDSLGRNERLAFLINAYNAFTLKLIVENYPLDSIKDIPDAKRWDAVRWNLAGKTVSLNQIEHEYVRPNFKEPRIHFALVCAAIGCPPLRNEAFTGEKLEEQLTQQSAYVHEHKTWFDFRNCGRQLGLTQLYNWYGDDFVQVAGSVEKFAARYSPALGTSNKQGLKPAIEWLDYDWALNDKTNKTPR